MRQSPSSTSPKSPADEVGGCPPDISDGRRQLRQRIRREREQLDPACRDRLSDLILRQLEEWPPYRTGRVVMAFASFRGEVDTRPIMRSVLARHQVLVLPKVRRQGCTLQLYVVRDLARDLVPGYQGIPEPDPGRCLPADPAAVDVVLVPGLVFDRQGYRLGYGGGYYDRFLASHPRSLRVGLAFSLQVVDYLPVLPHDERLDALVTEEGIVTFPPRSAPCFPER